MTTKQKISNWNESENHIITANIGDYDQDINLEDDHGYDIGKLIITDDSDLVFLPEPITLSQIYLVEIITLMETLK